MSGRNVACLPTHHSTDKPHTNNPIRKQPDDVQDSRLVPAQDAPFALILWYVSKIIYLSKEQDKFAIKSSTLFFDQIDLIVHVF